MLGFDAVSTAPVGALGDVSIAPGPEWDEPFRGLEWTDARGLEWNEPTRGVEWTKG